MKECTRPQYLAGCAVSSFIENAIAEFEPAKNVFLPQRCLNPYLTEVKVVFLPHNDLDDPAFISLLGSFVTAYATSTSATRIYLTHIDNWFGESWLGFGGKWHGIAGIRQRRGKLGTDTRARILAIPPFRPTRVQSYAGYDVAEDGTLQEFAVSPLHSEKNGGCIQTLYGGGLYVWYSGNTAANTTGSLMVYELNAGGQDAWYLNFSRDTHAKWNVISCRNTQLKECRAIADRHYQQIN